MATIEERIAEIGRLLDQKKGEAPERELGTLVRQLTGDELTEWRPKIDRLIARFLPKREKRLSKILEAKTGNGASSRAPEHGESATSIPSGRTRAPASEPDPKLAGDFRRRLDVLREKHIFQWATFYRDCLQEYLGAFFDEMRRMPASDGLSLSAALADHTRVAFSQGYEFTRSRHDHDEAIRKSLNGLSRFLALPVDYYSVRSSSPSDPEFASTLRRLVSAAVSGILEGYSQVALDRQTGSAVLPRFQRSWVHYMAFLIPRHAERVVDRLDPGSLAEGLRGSVLPLLDALQRFHDRSDDDYRPLPVTGQYKWMERRLDITVPPPRNAVSLRLLEVHAFLDEGFVSTADLDEAARSQTTLVIAPLKPDMRSMVSERQELAGIVVPAGDDRDEAATRAFKVWDAAVAALRRDWSTTTPITFNFARGFPLRDTSRDRATVYHVDRTSVRDLLQTYERRPGVRLWCSVRRSGKTTACLDLDSTSGDTAIVSQTCRSDQSEEAKFYRLVREAVRNRQMIPESFVEDAVARCAPPGNDEDRRLVLVIDEYETLFGVLESAVERDPGIRHAVVQPILDQLMTFSHENLLVFLGQQPDAHFILMEQNQLAPYVKQDPFPLFEHARQTTVGEFSMLVRKITGERIECTAGFLDALFEETAGHPFLTANVLVEFVEWLIEEKRSQLGLQVRSADFAEFRARKLNADRIRLSPDYDFFRNAAQGAMSPQGYRRNPWLFTAYWVMRELSNGSGQQRIERAGFPELLHRIPVPQGEPAPDGNDTLRSASQANFLSYDDDWVRVGIPILGRIAAAVRPGVN